jgi:phosphatidylinositol glycan class V
LTATGIENTGHLEPLVGIIIANISHLVSALILYSLGKTVVGDAKLSLIAAMLHIFTPAGLFVSVMYQESPCALLSFAGYLLYATSCREDGRPWLRDVLLVLAGSAFGLATTFRSNGILNGLLFAGEFVLQIPQLQHHPLDAIRRLVVLGIGGVCVASGWLVPQTIAFLEYCSGVAETDMRPWCSKFPPSIYTFVQHHYW